MVKLSVADITQIMESANVTAIRIPELISWHMQRNILNPTAWINWVHEIFDFALSNNLKICWSEWKIGPDIEILTTITLAGYEDKLTRLYQTNNQYQHPMIGYKLYQNYQRWGASVQSWWVNRSDIPNDNLPLEYVQQYATLARNMGAEVIQFEPYWYFYENGEPLEAFHIMCSIV